MNTLTSLAGLTTATALTAGILLPTTAAAAPATTATGPLKICQHGGGDARLSVYAEHPGSERAALLAPERCVTWSGVRTGTWYVDADQILGNCTDESYSVSRVTVSRPGFYRSVRWLPVRATVEPRRTTAVGIYLTSTC